MYARRIIMGMPISVEIVNGTESALDEVFNYFIAVDERFSTYKSKSEIMKMNRGECTIDTCSDDMREILDLADDIKKETHGYFSITRPDGVIDPSGVVKGWAIRNASIRIEKMGYKDYFLDVGGDIQSHGVDSQDHDWTVGIRSPFNLEEIVKVLSPNGNGVATSGTYIRGQHIYNPHKQQSAICDVSSLTVIGDDICKTDYFATAAFAMGMEGIMYIEQLDGFEGYSIAPNGVATMTSGFEQFTI